MKPTNETQAYLTGMVLGHLINHGIEVKPLTDEDGDYQAELLLTLPATEATPAMPVYLSVTAVEAPDA